jgi:hypothetical protein
MMINLALQLHPINVYFHFILIVLLLVFKFACFLVNVISNMCACVVCVCCVCVVCASCGASCVCRVCVLHVVCHMSCIACCVLCVCCGVLLVIFNLISLTIKEVLQRYREITPRVKLQGPTSLPTNKI